MNDALKRNIEEHILELQNDGQKYKIYQPVFDEIIKEHHYTPRAAGSKETQVDHVIDMFKGGSWSALLSSIPITKLYNCTSKAFRAGDRYKVIGGLFADYYREWKYQNDNKQEAADYWKPTVDDLAMEDAIEKCRLVKSGVNPCLEISLDTTNLKLKDTTMTIKIESKLFYNGVDIKNYTDDQLFAEIAKAEAEVERLEKIATKPKKLEAKIKELKEGIAQLAAAIDAR